MQTRSLAVLAALAAVASPDLLQKGNGALTADLRARFASDPMRSVLGTVLVGAYAFYRAEKGHNPKVNSYYDALVYVSTSLSVGYSDIFAKTAGGKAIGTALMTYGPAMAAKIFDPPAAEPETTSRDVVERLDRILAALEARS